MLCELMYRQNGDLANMLKSAQKKVPQSARLSAGGGGAKFISAMPKCLGHEFKWCFPNRVKFWYPSIYPRSLPLEIFSPYLGSEVP